MIYDDPVAHRYDEGRQLSQATLNVWLGAIASYAGSEDVRVILDVGCGTGRFSGGLADRLAAYVIGIDPSQAMIDKANAKLSSGRLSLCIAEAERIPVAAGSVCMIFLSMVYHHIQGISRAGREFRRVLRENGIMCIRNSTNDLLHRVRYLRHFSSALEFSRRRLPSQRDVIETMRSAGFMMLGHNVIEQEFAQSPGEYVARIRKRALSDLIILDDAEFEDGVRRMKEAAAMETGPVIEPVDLFVFRRA